MTECAEKTSIASETASVRRGQKMICITLFISIVTLLLQASPFLDSEFKLPKIFNEFRYLEAFGPAYVACLFILLPLYYYLLNGRQWARWSLAIIVLLIGLFSLIISIAIIVIETIGGLKSYDMRLYFELIIHFVIALVQLTVFSLFVFSESVGDFYDSQGGRLQWKHWNQFGKAKKSAKSTRLLDHKTINFNLNRREMFGRLFPKMTIILVFLGWIFFVLYLYHATDVVHNRIWDEPLPRDDWSKLGAILGNSMTEILEVIEVLVIGYLALFVFPTVMTLPWLIPLAYSWTNPIHFLLLRPFNRSWITGNLRGVIQNELSSLGHCYTLADLNIRVPLYIRVPFLFGQVSMFNFRLRKIRKPIHITRIVKGMSRRVIRNLNWYLSREKIFPVSCSDSGWRSCVGRLVQEVDVVIMDISGITENIIWEIELIKELGAIDRSIFLVNESDRLKSEQVLLQLFEGDYQSLKLITYPISGASNTGAIKSAAVNILCS